MHIHKVENIYFRNLNNNELRVLSSINKHLTFTSTHNAHLLYMASKYFGR